MAANPLVRCLIWTARGAAILAAVTMLGCAPQANDQQANDATLDMRGMIASDQQSIEALKAQLSQQQDEIDELRHSGAGGGGKVSKRQYAVIDDRLTKLETAVSALQSGQPAAGAPAAAAPVPPVPPPGGTPPGANPPGAPAVAAPGVPPEGENATPPPASDEAPPPGADSNPPTGGGDSASAGNPDSGAGAASGGPPPAAVPEVGSDWHSALDQQLVSAGTSSDPGASLYMKGLQDMKAGSYDDAVGHFGALMRRYPKSDLTEPAEYFSANALYESGKYEQSILQFNDLVIRSPDGRYASAALLREAQAFVKINDRIDARLTLQKLLADHSGSTEASAANSMLKDLQSD